MAPYFARIAEQACFLFVKIPTADASRRWGQNFVRVAAQSCKYEFKKFQTGFAENMEGGLPPRHGA